MSTTPVSLASEPSLADRLTAVVVDLLSLEVQCRAADATTATTAAETALVRAPTAVRRPLCGTESIYTVPPVVEAVAPHLWSPREDLTAGRVYGARHLELLDGIETILLTEGFRDLTVGGLAERLHCSRRTLYELADSKEDLVLLVIDRLFRRLGRRAHDAVHAETSHLQRLRAFLTKGLTELHRASLTFAQDVADDESAHALASAHFRYATNLVVTMLSDGVDAGEFAPIHPRIAAEVLDAGIARLQEPAVLRTAGVTFAEALEEFMTFFTDGIRAGGTT